jgi:hypothetical protein
MGMSLTALLILLLPGFWSMWIYQAYATSDIESKQWETKFIMGLSFGVLNVIAAFGVVYALVLTFPDWSLLERFSKMLPLKDNGVEVDTFIANLNEGRGFFSPDFLLFFCSDAVASMATATLFIILNKNEILPTMFIPNVLLKGNGYVTTQNNWMFDHFDREFLKGRAAIVIVSSLLDPNRRKVGIYGGASGKTKEIGLCHSNLFSYDDPWFKRLESYTLVDMNSAIVVDIFPEENEGELAKHKDELSDALKKNNDRL